MKPGQKHPPSPLQSVGGTPPTIAPAVLAAMQVSRLTSPLTVWLSDRFAQLSALGRIANWQALCDQANAEGIRNAHGDPITPAVISGTWSRLKSQRQRESARRNAG